MRTVNFKYPQDTVRNMRLDRVINRPVGILGMARSGLASARLIKRLGGKPFVSDNQPEAQLKDRISELKSLDIPFEVGGHSDAILEFAEYIITSPGVPNDNPIILKAEELGIPVFSELELAFWLCDANIAAITGSNGKTTTTSLLGEIFKTAGYDTYSAGNIGYPFSEICDRMQAEGWVSLEVSSFQLERIFDFRPDIAVILNLTPDHLDRYTSFEEYAETKFRIAENQTPSDTLILNADDDYLMELGSKVLSRKIYISQRLPVHPGIYLEGDSIKYKIDDHEGDLGGISDIRIPGPHNLYNAMAAGAAALTAGVSEYIIRRVFREFPGVEHRLEYVDTVNGIKFVNDSKATNIDSVWYALKSIPENMVLILGGRFKGGDLKHLNKLISEKVKRIILIGESQKIMQNAYESATEISSADSLQEAVYLGYESASEGEVVLLSPACASFDMFTDFEERGRIFKDTVYKLAEETRS